MNHRFERRIGNRATIEKGLFHRLDEKMISAAHRRRQSRDCQGTQDAHDASVVTLRRRWGARAFHIAIDKPERLDHFGLCRCQIGGCERRTGRGQASDISAVPVRLRRNHARRVRYGSEDLPQAAAGTAPSRWKRAAKPAIRRSHRPELMPEALRRADRKTLLRNLDRVGEQVAKALVFRPILPAKRRAACPSCRPAPPSSALSAVPAHRGSRLPGGHRGSLPDAQECMGLSLRI